MDAVKVRRFWAVLAIIFLALAYWTPVPLAIAVLCVSIGLMF